MASSPPSLVKTWHTASYPAISPSRSELSAAGKAILITGGGTGIGESMARSFAAAGSKKIAITGRRLEPLQKTATSLESSFPGLRVLPLSMDVTNKAQVDTAFDSVASEFGSVDVLVSNAGYGPAAAPIAEMDPEDAWTAFEVHVKGNIHVAQAFSRVASPEGAVVIHTSTIIVAISAAFPGAAAYTASKLAATKLWASFGAENPHVRVVNIQPGTIATDMTSKLGIEGQDDADLPGNFSVWLASPEAAFLNGKFVTANWDVDELKARKEEFESTDLGTIKLEGF